MRRVATCVSPTCSGYFTFWFNIAVTAGRTDKFWPRTNAHQRCIPGDAAVHALVPYQASVAVVPGSSRRNPVPLSLSVAYRAQRADPRRTSLPASVQQAHIFHAGIKHNLRHTRCSVYVTPVQNDRGVMANAVFCQHRFQLFIRNFVPQRFAFHFVGVDVVSAGNMADKVKFWSARAASMTFQSPAGFAVTSLPCCRSCSHCGYTSCSKCGSFCRREGSLSASLRMEICVKPAFAVAF